MIVLIHFRKYYGFCAFNDKMIFFKKKNAVKLMLRERTDANSFKFNFFPLQININSTSRIEHFTILKTNMTMLAILSM